MYVHLFLCILCADAWISVVSQTDPAKTVQIFIDLIQRHEQAFYTFVHKVHSKGEGLFTGLMRWIELFLTLMRDGVGERMSLEFLLPHTGEERSEIIREVDAVALYHYKLKVAYEAKLRKRFGRTQGMNDADAEDDRPSGRRDGRIKPCAAPAAGLDWWPHPHPHSHSLTLGPALLDDRGRSRSSMRHSL